MNREIGNKLLDFIAAVQAVVTANNLVGSINLTQAVAELRDAINEAPVTK